MATASVLCVEVSEKECSVCNELFTEPKLLPCGHLLCYHCVLSWLHKQQHASCPLCRCPIVDTEKWGSSEIDFDAFADSLPTDLAMKALVDAERILNTEHQCVCEDVAATAVCLDCGDYLCPACSKGHKKQSVTKHHVVEELSSLTTEKLTAKRWEEPCAVHADKTSEVFCPKHGTSVCILCATTDHRQCPDVTSLETKMMEAQKILQDMAATLSKGEARLERGLSDLEQHMDTLEKKAQAAIAEIEDTCNRLESAVKACRLRLKELTKGVGDDIKVAVNGGKSVLLSRKGKLTTHKGAVCRAQGMTSRSAIGRMTQALQVRVKELDDTTTLPSEFDVKHTPLLVIDSKFVQRIETLLLTLGQSIPKLQFHTTRGYNINLSNNNQTAETRNNQNEHGSILLGSEPMAVGMLYEVRIDELWKQDITTGMLPVGIVTASPEELTLPKSSFEPSWGKAVMLLFSRIDVLGKQVESALGQMFANMPVGSRVGISLNESRDLLVYYNGELKGTISTAVPDPVYPLFNLTRVYKKVTALPVRIAD